MKKVMVVIALVSTGIALYAQEAQDENYHSAPSLGAKSAQKISAQERSRLPQSKGLRNGINTRGAKGNKPSKAFCNEHIEQLIRQGNFCQ